MADTPKEILMTFDWDGETVHKEAKGFTGSACLASTKFLEEALGGKDLKRKMKEETVDGKLRKPQLTSGLKL
jgi:hypothetical protein